MTVTRQQQSKLPNQFSPVTKDAHRKLHSTRSNPVASSDVMRPSNFIQQTPYIHHPSILYGNPPGIASGPFVSPVPVVPAVVAPPLQTQLHHGCGMVVSHATPNGNLVNCQNNMESQGGCVQWVCLVRGEGVSVPGRASYPGMSKHVESVGVLMKNIMQSV